MRKGLAKLEPKTLQSFSQWHSDAKNDLSKPILCLVKDKNEKLRRKCNCTPKCTQTEFVADFASDLCNSLFLTSSSEDIYEMFNEGLSCDMEILFNFCKQLKSAFSNFCEGAIVKFQNGSDWDQLKTITSKIFVFANVSLEEDCVTPLFKTEKFNVFSYVCHLNKEIVQMSNAHARLIFDLCFLQEK